MITDVIDLSSDDNSHSECGSSLPVTSNVKRRTNDSDTDPSTQVTSEFEKSPNSNKKRRVKRKAGSSQYDKKKKVTAEERREMKRKLAEERRAAKNANKMYKPGECMKYMTIEMHPVLLESWFCADIQREASASGVKVKSSPSICDSGLVLWTRHVMPKLSDSDGFVQLTPSKVKCDQGLYIKTAKDIEELVVNRTLSDNIKQAVQLAGCKLSLVIFDLKDYYKACGRKGRSEGQMSEIELEKAITDLLVSADCDTIIVNTPNELALTIVQFTKAIAEDPYKKSQRALDEQADFYMRGDNKKCVPIDKDGHGIARLWQQMLGVLPLSSLETSRAICARYKTPVDLYESLQSQGVAELSSLGVHRAAVPGAKARRVGPELAKKIHILFTEDDGAALLH